MEGVVAACGECGAEAQTGRYCVRCGAEVRVPDSGIGAPPDPGIGPLPVVGLRRGRYESFVLEVRTLAPVGLLVVRRSLPDGIPSSVMWIGLPSAAKRSMWRSISSMSRPGA